MITRPDNHTIPVHLHLCGSLSHSLHLCRNHSHPLHFRGNPSHPLHLCGNPSHPLHLCGNPARPLHLCGNPSHLHTSVEPLIPYTYMGTPHPTHPYGNPSLSDNYPPSIPSSPISKHICSHTHTNHLNSLQTHLYLLLSCTL